MPSTSAISLALLSLVLLAPRVVADDWSLCSNAYWPGNEGDICVAYESYSSSDGDESDPQAEVELTAIMFDHELNTLSTAPMSEP
jgi:hypothetical protein